MPQSSSVWAQSPKEGTLGLCFKIGPVAINYSHFLSWRDLSKACCSDVAASKLPRCERGVFWNDRSKDASPRSSERTYYFKDENDFWDAPQSNISPWFSSRTCSADPRTWSWSKHVCPAAPMEGELRQGLQRGDRGRLRSDYTIIASKPARFYRREDERPT